jgi:4-amino-4-deoxy-L-arabinose transferase-like glycosyltransferase
MGAMRTASTSFFDRAANARERMLAPAVAGVAVVLAQGLVFVPVAAVRFLDGDEGSYALAAKLVMQGELPYRDFVYGQMPLLPYVYGSWTAVTGESWYGIRLLSALFAMGIGALLYGTLASRFGRRLAALGVGLYALSAPVFVWLPTLKTYVVPTFLLFAAYTVVARPERLTARRWLAAGVMSGLAVDARLLFAAAVPALAWGVYRAGRDRAHSLGALAGGLVLGLAPAWFFLALDPSRFAYDNLGAYGRQSPGGLVGDLNQKVRVIENLLGIGTPAGAVPQFLLLTVCGLAAAIGLQVLRTGIPLSLVVAAALAVGNLAPTPTYAQYFCTTVPFLVVGTIELAGALQHRLRPASDLRLHRALVWLLAAVAAFYAAIGLVELRRSLGLYRDQRIESVRTVTRVVEEQTAPGERVLTSWPGYLFETDARPVRGLESDFAPQAAARLSPSEARRHLRASAADVEAMIRRHATRLLVVKLWHIADMGPDWWGTAERSGYRLLTEIPAGNSEVGGSVRIYVVEGR